MYWQNIDECMNMILLEDEWEKLDCAGLKLFRYKFRENHYRIYNSDE